MHIKSKTKILTAALIIISLTILSNICSFAQYDYPETMYIDNYAVYNYVYTIYDSADNIKETYSVFNGQTEKPAVISHPTYFFRAQFGYNIYYEGTLQKVQTEYLESTVTKYETGEKIVCKVYKAYYAGVVRKVTVT